MSNRPLSRRRGPSIDERLNAAEAAVVTSLPPCEVCAPKMPVYVYKGEEPPPSVPNPCPACGRREQPRSPRDPVRIAYIELNWPRPRPDKDSENEDRDEATAPD